MSAARFTPGPWAFYPETGRIDALQFRKPTGYITPAGAEYIGGMVALPYSCGDDEHRDTRDANGQLMAAAPDMFKTLQDMDGWLANTSHGEDHPWRISIRDAIAKATGSAA